MATATTTVPQPARPRTRQNSLPGLISLRPRTPASLPNSDEPPLDPAAAAAAADDGDRAGGTLGRRGRLGSLIRRSLKPRLSSHFRSVTADAPPAPAPSSSPSPPPPSLPDLDLPPAPVSPPSPASLDLPPAPPAAPPPPRVEPVEVRPVTDGPSHPPTRSSSVRRPASPGPSATLAPAATSSSSAAPSPSSSSSRHHGSSSKRQQRVIGDYFLGKTLGAGSMGKVKLGLHVKTGAKVAIKIIPRVPPDAHRHLAQQALANYQRQPYRSDGSPATPPPPLPTDSFVAKAIAKEQSKEVRTVREAHIMKLLHHPHICGMQEMVVHTNHYYMMFELVSGGQMLDYIISHGRLRERAARKFARQIGSALEYCHRNSIVHRDLKIENILISSTGNIKIIDFGLSNLFSPFTQLSTFCGSLYFAAPELLNAKVYTGPEVDVWSFGIVLYVLVCGKVPFDDQSMPALHAKIKRGLVEYPPWLSIECKQILQRMLVTNPAYRAPLSEVMAHPWMTKGFDGAPDPHLVPREPLRADELDWRVVEGMVGFEFGPPDEIEQRLRDVLESDSYRSALAAWEARKAGVRGGPAGWRNNAHLHESSASLPSTSGRSDGSFDSHAGLAGAGSPQSLSKKSKRASGFDFFKKKLFSSSPKEDKAAPGTNGGAHVNGVTGVGVQPAGEPVQELLDPTRGFHPLISIYYLVREKMERERVYGPGHFASSDMSLPTSADIYAQQQQQPAANGLATAPPPVATPAPLLKSASSRLSTSSAYSQPLPRLPAPASAVPSPSSRMTAVDLGARAGPVPRTRAGLDEPGLGDPAVVMQHPSADEATTRLVSPSGNPPTPTTPDLPRAPGAASHRRSQSLSLPSVRPRAKPPRESSVHSSVFHDAPPAASARPQSVLIERTPTADVFTQPTLPTTAEDDEAAAVSSPPLESTSAPVAEPVQIPISSPPESAAQTSPSLAKRFSSMRTAPNATGRAQDASRAEAEDAKGDFKPIYLKGLFSVATTSTRSASTLSADIQKVLSNLSIQYRPLRGGFECVHAPSIDLTSVVPDAGGKQGGAIKTLRPSSPSLPLSPPVSPVKTSPPPRMPAAAAADQQDSATDDDADAWVAAAPVRTTTMGSGAGGLGGGRGGGDGLSDMVVRFEIMVIKVPWLPLHGVQFRRVGGNAWQYQMLAKRILAELKL